MHAPSSWKSVVDRGGITMRRGLAIRQRIRGVVGAGSPRGAEPPAGRGAGGRGRVEFGRQSGRVGRFHRVRPGPALRGEVSLQLAVDLLLGLELFGRESRL